MPLLRKDWRGREGGKKRNSFCLVAWGMLALPVKDDRMKKGGGRGEGSRLLSTLPKIFSK